MKYNFNKFDTYYDYQKIVDRILQPLVSLCDKTKSYINLPHKHYTNYSILEGKIETFSRMLLGASIIEQTHSQKRTFFSMIKNGVNPNSSYYWGKISNYSQSIVEMFPILHYCVRNKEEFHLFFTNEDKHNIQQWFIQINNVEVCDNNWHFFPILVNLFLYKLGFNHNQQSIKDSWEKIDNMYLGNGWYSDGNSQQRDYYISFAFHFYSLLYAYYSIDIRRNELIKKRAEKFAQSYIHYFASSGEAIPFGRSLTYKFTHIAFWSIYSNFITNRQQLGIIKGIINRNLRWWMKQNIFDNNGLLINGYAYENPFMLEQYNGTGSPYWAFKAFYFMLNSNSLFFKTKEENFPKIEPNIYIPEAYTTIRHFNGHSYAFVNGQSNKYFCNKTAKYEKFVYSTLFGFSVSRSFETLEMLALDNTLAVKIENEIIVRSNAKIIYNDDKIQISEWCPTKNVTIRTYIIPGAPLHTRIHHVSATIALTLFDCGHATNSDTQTMVKTTLQSAVISGKDFCSSARSERGNAGIIHCAPYTNILFPHSRIPYIYYNHNIGRDSYVSTFYGDTTEQEINCTPNINSIKIDKNKIHINETTYPLPQVTFYNRLFFTIINTYRIIRKVFGILLKHK